MMTSLTYAISYFREGFRISTEWGSILLSLLMVCAAVGNLVTGRIVARLGRKRSATALTLGMGVSIIVIYNSGLLWLSTVFLLPWALSAGVAYVAGDSLTLDQVPEYRGTLMSMNALARSLGTTISAMIGGFLILLYGYGVFGIFMGVLGIAASVTYHLFTEEPG
jgi:predicted MFS family arabinose efflux permease